MSASETDGMLQIMLVNSCPAPKVQKREACRCVDVVHIVSLVGHDSLLRRLSPSTAPLRCCQQAPSRFVLDQRHAWKPEAARESPLDSGRL
jgi:hypothetical protein